MIDAFTTSREDYDYQEKLHKYQEGKAEDPQWSPGNGGTSGTTSNKELLQERYNSYKKGLLKFNYKEYCFLLMLLTVTNQEQIARLSNLIQMESHYYYRQKQGLTDKVYTSNVGSSGGGSSGGGFRDSSESSSGVYTFDFSLYKSYTFVDVTADVKVEQILPSLTDSSLFELERRNYRGY